jgi:hypothetical protein
MFSFTKFREPCSQSASDSTCRRDRGKTRPALESLEARNLQSALSGAVDSTTWPLAGKAAPQVHSGQVPPIVCPLLNTWNSPATPKYQTELWGVPGSARAMSLNF